MKQADAIKKVGENYEGLVSAQLELNKLKERQADQEKGIYGAMLKGIGLTKNHTSHLDEQKKALEKLKDRAVELGGKESAEYERQLASIEESIKAGKKAEQAQKEAIGEFEGLFPGLVSGVKKLGAGFKTLNTIMKANPLLAIAAIVIGIVAMVIKWVKAVNEVVEKFGVTRAEARKINVQLTNLVNQITLSIPACSLKSSCRLAQLVYRHRAD